VNAMKTNVNICGCAAQFCPPAVFPPPETPDSCLASGIATTSLQKRTQVFSQAIDPQVIGSYKYTCSVVSDSLQVDSIGNPNQDCLNMMAKICHPSYMGNDTARISGCKNSVNSMTRGMNPHWQNVRKACGQWKFTDDGTIGSVTSESCASANIALQKYAYYILDGTRTLVPSSLTDSINKGLWSNPALKE